KPATSSLVSAYGPSITVRCLPSKRTRAPLELGCRPSPISITPASTSFSLNLPISASSLASGMPPASDSSLAFTITNTRMTCLRCSGNRPVSIQRRTTQGGIDIRNFLDRHQGGGDITGAACEDCRLTRCHGYHRPNRRGSPRPALAPISSIVLLRRARGEPGHAGMGRVPALRLVAFGRVAEPVL